MNPTEADWYYLNESNEPTGPLLLDDLKGMMTDGKICSDSLVCQEGDESWRSLFIALEIAEQMRFFNHLDTIGQVLIDRENAEQENTLIAVDPSGSLSGIGLTAGPLHNDVFGNIYSGTSPFSVGKIDHLPGHAGTLHTDEFGNIYSGDSHLPVAHTPVPPVEPGVLHSDEFGNVYPGDSPFPVDHIGPHDHD